MEKNFIIAGFGGQGVLLAGTILANAFMLEGKNVTWYPCYGAEMRGGTVNCEIVVSDEEVSSVHKNDADVVLALNQLSFDKFLPKIKKGGIMIANSSLVEETRPRNDIQYEFAPITKLATDLEEVKVTNVVSLGLLARVCGISVPALKAALDKVLPSHRKNLLPLNEKALDLGYNSVVKC